MNGPSGDGCLCIQHSSKDQLWLLQESSCLKLTFVSLAIDPRTVCLQRSDLCLNRHYTNSNCVGAVLGLPGKKEEIDLS